MHTVHCADYYNGGCMYSSTRWFSCSICSHIHIITWLVWNFVSTTEGHVHCNKSCLSSHRLGMPTCITVHCWIVCARYKVLSCIPPIFSHSTLLSLQSTYLAIGSVVWFPGIEPQPCLITVTFVMLSWQGCKNSDDTPWQSPSWGCEPREHHPQAEKLVNWDNWVADSGWVKTLAS